LLNLFLHLSYSLLIVYFFRYGETDPAYYEFTLGKAYVFSIGTLLMRGWSDVPKTAASRCAFIWYENVLITYFQKILQKKTSREGGRVDNC
jgi:hypothetical protein